MDTNPEEGASEIKEAAEGHGDLSNALVDPDTCGSSGLKPDESMEAVDAATDPKMPVPEADIQIPDSVILARFQELKDQLNPELLGKCVAAEVAASIQPLLRKLIAQIDDPLGHHAYRLLGPLIKGIIGIYDLLTQLEGGLEAVDSAHAKNYGVIRRQILQMFNMCNICPISPEPGAPFDPSRHRAVANEDARAPEEDMTVAGITRDGFLFHGTVIRPADVKLKRLASS